jgi:hypothetical protein
MATLYKQDLSESGSLNRLALHVSRQCMKLMSLTARVRCEGRGPASLDNLLFLHSFGVNEFNEMVMMFDDM